MLCIENRLPFSVLKCIVAENNSLKAQLEESKAELGLKTIQVNQVRQLCVSMIKDMVIAPPDHTE